MSKQEFYNALSERVGLPVEEIKLMPLRQIRDLAIALHENEFELIGLIAGEVQEYKKSLQKDPSVQGNQGDQDLIDTVHNPRQSR